MKRRQHPAKKLTGLDPYQAMTLVSRLEKINAFTEERFVATGEMNREGWNRMYEALSDIQVQCELIADEEL